MQLEAGGHRIDYELRGEGPTVVLLHGLTTDRRVLVEACDGLLAERALRRLYLDLPGHGRSTADPARLSADDVVDAVATLVRRELRPAGDGQVEAPLILGYSYGGYLAQGLVRVLGGARAVLLVCPVVEPDFARRQPPPRRVAAEEAELAYSGDERERSAFEEVAVKRTAAVLSAFQRGVHPANVSVDPAAVAALRARYQFARPIGEALTGLSGPVTIVCGRDDHWAGFYEAALLVRHLRAPHFVVLPDCGQLQPFEQPRAFAQVVRDWLARAGC